MAFQGPNPTSLGGNNTSVGSFVWGGTTSIYASDDVRAFASDVAGGTSNYLTAQGFSFTIPSGSSIDGIFVEIERSANLDSGSDFVRDAYVNIIKADGTIGTVNKADNTTHWPTTDAFATYGSSTDTWGLAWTDGNINSANFGVAIASLNNSGNSTARVDYIRITVYYTANATTTSTSFSTSSTSSSSTSSSTSSTSSSTSTSSTSSSISSTSSSTSISTSTTTTIMSLGFQPRATIRQWGWK